MKVTFSFEVENPEELEKVNEAIKQLVPEYKIKIEIESEDINKS